MSAAGYPLIVSVTPSTLAAWGEDELASWEDHGCPDTGHVRNVLTRRRSQLVIENADELALVIASGAYHGTDGAWDDRHAYRAAVARVVERLR